MNLKQAAWFSAVPWGTMAVSGYMAGKASDSLIRAGYSLTLVRKIMQVIIPLSKSKYYRSNMLDKIKIHSIQLYNIQPVLNRTECPPLSDIRKAKRKPQSYCEL